MRKEGKLFLWASGVLWLQVLVCRRDPGGALLGATGWRLRCTKLLVSFPITSAAKVSSFLVLFFRNCLHKVKSSQVQLRYSWYYWLAGGTGISVLLLTVRVEEITMEQLYAGGMDWEDRSASMAHSNISCSSEAASRRYSGGFLGLAGKSWRKRILENSMHRNEDMCVLKSALIVRVV